MKRNSLNMTSIFRCMMENGYYPTFEKTHIIFDIDDNLGVVEYEEGVLSIRIFFTIEEDAYDMFLEASNAAMTESLMVKSALLNDNKSLMFSFETLCSTKSQFREFFPAGVEMLRKAIAIHRQEMTQLIIAEDIVEKTIPAIDEFQSTAGNFKSNKILS